MSFGKTLLKLLSISLVLIACSPHPGSGEWLARAEGNYRFSRLKVEFDGKAYLFVPNKEDHQLRCFWAGESASLISMDCILNDPSERRSVYQFRVVDQRSGELMTNGNVVGRFQRN